MTLGLAGFLLRKGLGFRELRVLQGFFLGFRVLPPVYLRLLRSCLQASSISTAGNPLLCSHWAYT